MNIGRYHATNTIIGQTDHFMEEKKKEHQRTLGNEDWEVFMSLTSKKAAELTPAVLFQLGDEQINLCTIR